MKKLSCLLTLLLLLSLAACNRTPNAAPDGGTADPTVATTAVPSSSGFNEEALIAQLTTREYIYTFSDGEQCVFYEIANGSDRDLYITVTADFLVNGMVVCTESDDIDILASGATYVVYFTPTASFDAVEYTPYVYGTQKVPAALSYDLSVDDNGIERLTCNNTSFRNAETFAGYVLYLKDDAVIDYDISYFSVAAGESETENVDTDTAYDSYKVYVGSALTE